MSSLQASFYQIGGSLPTDAVCYVPRRADEDLYQGVKQGEFCYVLTSRQMGKSSLMGRVAHRLRAEGGAVVILDLTGIGIELDAEQWYYGLLSKVGAELGLEQELDDYWDAHLKLGPLQRWIGALRDIVLERRAGPIVLFVDEIDVVRGLRKFSTDEFFAAIRECFNRRTDDPEMRRLTFCLFGVATPSDLIRETRTTPFNIGRRIELHDFTATEASRLGQGLQRTPGQAALLLERVYHWTGGHPYLTQVLCKAVAESPEACTSAAVDRVCEELFLSYRARERDNNLVFVRERMLRSEVDRAGLLELYGRVWAHKHVPDDVTNPLVSVLRLSGITTAQDGRLVVRNRIYRHVFDRQWVRTNMPDAEVQRQRQAYRRGVMRAGILATAIMAVMGWLGWMAWTNRLENLHNEEAFKIAETKRNIERQVEDDFKNKVLDAYNKELKQRGLAEKERERAAGLAKKLEDRSYSQDLQLAHFTWQRGEFARARDHLQTCPDQLRNWEWRHLDLLTKPELLTLPAADKVQHLTFSGDGRRLAGAAGKAVIVWDSSTGKELRTFKADPVRLVFFGSGDRLGFLGDGGELEVWDVATGKRLQHLQYAKKIRQPSVTPDGGYLAGLTTVTDVQIWEPATNKFIDLPRQSGAVSRIALSPNGQRLGLVLEDTTIRIMTTSQKDEKPIHLTGHSKPITHLAFSADGKRLASVGLDRSIRVWDAAQPQKDPIILRHTQDIIDVVFSANGQWLASVSADGVRIWDVVSNEQHPLPHPSRVDQVAFSPDDRWLATNCWDGKLRLWDVKNRKLQRQLTQPSRSPSRITFSPNGQYLAYVAEDRDNSGLTAAVRMWDLSDDRDDKLALEHFSKNRFLSTQVAFSPDNRWLAFAADDRLLIRDVVTGNEVANLLHKNPKNPVTEFAFNKDSRSITTMSLDSSARVWDVKTNEFRQGPGLADASRIALSAGGERVVWTKSQPQLMVQDLENGKLFSPDVQSKTIHLVAFSPDAQLLAWSGEDRKINVWDVLSNKPLRPLVHGDVGKFFAEEVSGLAFSPDGRRLASASWGQIKVWNVQTGKVLRSLKTTLDITRLLFSPDGKLLMSASRDRRIETWDVENGKKLYSSPLSDLSGNIRADYTTIFSPDSTHLALTTGDLVKVLDAATGQELNTLKGHNDVVNQMAFSPDGRRLATAGDDKTVKIWSVAGKKETLNLQKHTQPVSSIHFASDGNRLVSAGSDKKVIVWDLEGDREPVVLEGHTGPVRHAVFSPDATQVASASQDDSLQVWNAKTGKKIHTLAGHKGRINRVEFQPGGKLLASAGDDKKVMLWDAHGKKLRELDHAGKVSHIAFSPNGKHLATAGKEDNVKLWDPETGAVLHETQGNPGQVKQISFSPDNHRLAVASETGVQLWDLKQVSAEPYLLALDGGVVTDVAFSPKDQRLAVATNNKSIRIFDLAAKQLLKTLAGHTSRVNGIAFSPDGKRLVSAGDKSVRLWDIDTGLELLTLVGQKGIRQVLFGPDGKRLAAAGDSSAILVWESVADAKTLVNRERAWQDAQAEKHLDAREWSAAEFHLTQLLKEKPDAKDHRRRGRVHAELDRHDLANRDFSAAKELEPAASMNSYLLGMVCLAKNDIAGLKEICAGMFKQFKDTTEAEHADNLVWLATLLPEVENAAELARLIEEQAVKHHPESFDYLETLGAAHYRAGDFHKAIKRLEEAVAKQGKGGTVWMQLFLAMANRQVDRQQEMHQWLDRAAATLADADEISWQNKARWAHLLREAETLTGRNLFVLRIVGRIEAGDPDLTSSEKHYQAQLAPGKTYFIDFKGTGNPYVRLEDSSKKQLANADGQNAALARLVFTPERGGDFHIFAGGARGPFQLIVHEAPAAQVVNLELKDGKAVLQDRLSSLNVKDKTRVKSFCKIYQTSLTGGKVYQIEMSRTSVDRAFEPYLRLEDSSGKQLAFHDSNGAPKARMTFRCAASGTYSIIATTYAAGAGEFTLSVAEKSSVKTEWKERKLTLSGGKTELEDALTPDDGYDEKLQDSFAKHYLTPLNAGKTYQIDMVSTNLDPYLRLVDGSGAQVAVDDDSGGSLNSRINYTPAKDGTFRIIATSFNGGETGRYTLRIQEK